MTPNLKVVKQVVVNFFVADLCEFGRKRSVKYTTDSKVAKRRPTITGAISHAAKKVNRKAANPLVVQESLPKCKPSCQL
jgi:hypothetical protein